MYFFPGYFIAVRMLLRFFPRAELAASLVDKFELYSKEVVSGKDLFAYGQVFLCSRGDPMV